MTPAQRAVMLQRHLANRERMAALVNNNPPSPPGLPLLPGRPLQELHGEASAEFHGSANQFIIGRNLVNGPASGASGATLAEPAAVNDGKYIFYSGNVHQEYSTDSGATWINIPFPAGPADAPNACCDIDSVYDQARGVIFRVVLYLNSTGTNGVVKTFVRRTVNGADSCSYTYDPGGTTSNVVPDYPHLGLSNKYLYMTANLALNGTTWNGSVVRRINIDQMADCAAATVTTWTYPSTAATGQRVFVPAEGTAQRDRAYWALLENTTQLRIYRWLESAGAPTSFLRGINTSTHNNPDCRGGTNNTDWLERATSYSIAGFRLRGALGGNSSAGAHLGFWWNVSEDANHPQAHIHAAVFTEPSVTLVSQPHIWNSISCFGYPAVAANERGDFGISLAHGGRAGGGGLALHGDVGMSDEYSNGGTPGSIGSTVYTVATGTHNPPGPDFRYGDYLTVRQHEPCDLFFSATAYALNGGTSVSNVNARYVEFGRNRDNKCYIGWRDAIRTP